MSGTDEKGAKGLMGGNPFLLLIQFSPVSLFSPLPCRALTGEACA
jgi:hypothetical protein